MRVACFPVAAMFWIVCLMMSGQQSAPAAPKVTGGHVVAPVLIYQQPPHFSFKEGLLRSKGSTEVRVVVDTAGVPHDISVVRSCGKEVLDRRATEAVETYRFKPGTMDGHPVRVEMYIEVDFQ